MDTKEDNWTVSDQMFADISDLQFVSKVFHPYPALRTKQSKDGWSTTKPYRGGGYDETAFVLIEGGWNHEHCSFCSERIADRDTFWSNTDEVIILCPKCFDHYRDRIGNK